MTTDYAGIPEVAEWPEEAVCSVPTFTSDGKEFVCHRFFMLNPRRHLPDEPAIVLIEKT